MKKSIYTLVLAASLVAGGTVFAVELESENNSFETQLCMAAASGSLVQFNQKLKDTNLSKKHVVENVRCNGESLIDFVAYYGKNPQKMIENLDVYEPDVHIYDVAKR